VGVIGLGSLGGLADVKAMCRDGVGLGVNPLTPTVVIWVQL